MRLDPNYSKNKLKITFIPHKKTNKHIFELSIYFEMFVCCYNSSVSRTHLATFKKSFLIQNLNNLKPVAYILQDFLDKVSKIDSLKNY